MSPRRKFRRQASESPESIGESIAILGLPRNALETFGGSEGFQKFLNFVEAAKAQDDPHIAAFVVEGTDLYPRTGLPSTFIASDPDIAFAGGQQLMFSAMMQGYGGASSGDVYVGTEAVPYVDEFLLKAAEALSGAVASELIARARSLVSAE